jgi:hypothetical protein
MLGLCDAMLHAESADILRLFGEKRELARLRKVPHLGVAAYTITGINHSRLEYLLLQCSIISIVAKQFKNESAVALAGTVRIPGQSTPISSGEELLKAWALLGNFGHLQHTYAEERAYLLAARNDSEIRKWLLDCSRSRAIREWARLVIDEGNDGQLHYLFCFKRIALGPAHDRRRGLAERILSALLQPIDHLYPGDSSAKFKLARLRHVFDTVRLLSMLAIDSYYSAQPIRFQIAQSVLGLPELMNAMTAEGAHLGQLLNQTAAWLADALYLAPDVVSLRKAYEVKAARKIEKCVRSANTERALRKAFERSLWNGALPVARDGYRHLVRLTLQGRLQRMLIPRDKFAATAMFGTDVIVGAGLASVDINTFSGAAHVDLLIHREQSSIDAWHTLGRLLSWAARAIEAQALNELRRLVPAPARADKKATGTVRERFLTRVVKQHLSLVPQVFVAVIHELLPAGWTLEIEREGLLSRDQRTIKLRARFGIGVTIDELGPYLTEQLADNPHGLSAASLQELATTQRVLDKSDSAVVIGCIGKIVIKDQVGRSRDELDGLFLELDGTDLRVRMVEAKSGGSARQRENDAMNQLKQTRAWIRRRTTGMSCVRRRIRGSGAMLIVQPLTPTGNG